MSHPSMSEQRRNDNGPPPLHVGSLHGLSRRAHSTWTTEMELNKDAADPGVERGASANSRQTWTANPPVYHPSRFNGVIANDLSPSLEKHAISAPLPPPQIYSHGNFMDGRVKARQPQFNVGSRGRHEFPINNAQASLAGPLEYSQPHQEDIVLMIWNYLQRNRFHETLASFQNECQTKKNIPLWSSLAHISQQEKSIVHLETLVAFYAKHSASTANEGYSSVSASADDAHNYLKVLLEDYNRLKQSVRGNSFENYGAQSSMNVGQPRHFEGSGDTFDSHDQYNSHEHAKKARLTGGISSFNVQQQLSSESTNDSPHKAIARAEHQQDQTVRTLPSSSINTHDLDMMELLTPTSSTCNDQLQRPPHYREEHSQWLLNYCDTLIKDTTLQEKLVCSINEQLAEESSLMKRDGDPSTSGGMLTDKVVANIVESVNNEPSFKQLLKNSSTTSSRKRKALKTTKKKLRPSPASNTGSLTSPTPSPLLVFPPPHQPLPILPAHPNVPFSSETRRPSLNESSSMLQISQEVVGNDKTTTPTSTTDTTTASTLITFATATTTDASIDATSAATSAAAQVTAISTPEAQSFQPKTRLSEEEEPSRNINQPTNSIAFCSDNENAGVPIVAPFVGSCSTSKPTSITVAAPTAITTTSMDRFSTPQKAKMKKLESRFFGKALPILQRPTTAKDSIVQKKCGSPLDKGSLPSLLHDKTTWTKDEKEKDAWAKKSTNSNDENNSTRRVNQVAEAMNLEVVHEDFLSSLDVDEVLDLVDYSN